ncbi:unnamed protein product [Vitrella brassicaformis CCMP3155]|uniref:Uncharacterized protein n=2 Tax=Vitrella brassicaformis TaxID=1169539 RepID=A0A0G4FVX3_VITBC|nr:unnamed protein product [Vitrella brassicaformis CCMP3155]|eukprot:CEM19334.1 unnamed protein product [Vitrella brassicaformis CCMP3155]
MAWAPQHYTDASGKSPLAPGPPHPSPLSPSMLSDQAALFQKLLKQSTPPTIDPGQPAPPYTASPMAMDTPMPMYQQQQGGNMTPHHHHHHHQQQHQQPPPGHTHHKPFLMQPPAATGGMMAFPVEGSGVYVPPPLPYVPLDSFTLEQIERVWSDLNNLPYTLDPRSFEHRAVEVLRGHVDEVSGRLPYVVKVVVLGAMAVRYSHLNVEALAGEAAAIIDREFKVDASQAAVMIPLDDVVDFYESGPLALETCDDCARLRNFPYHGLRRLRHDVGEWYRQLSRDIRLGLHLILVRRCFLCGIVALWGRLSTDGLASPSYAPLLMNTILINRNESRGSRLLCASYRKEHDKGGPSETTMDGKMRVRFKICWAAASGQFVSRVWIPIGHVPLWMVIRATRAIAYTVGNPETPCLNLPSPPQLDPAKEAKNWYVMNLEKGKEVFTFNHAVTTYTHHPALGPDDTPAPSGSEKRSSRGVRGDQAAGKKPLMSPSHKTTGSSQSQHDSSSPAGSPASTVGPVFPPPGFTPTPTATTPQADIWGGQGAPSPSSLQLPSANQQTAAIWAAPSPTDRSVGMVTPSPKASPPSGSGCDTFYSLYSSGSVGFPVPPESSPSDEGWGGGTGIHRPPVMDPRGCVSSESLASRHSPAPGSVGNPIRLNLADHMSPTNRLECGTPYHQSTDSGSGDGGVSGRSFMSPTSGAVLEEAVGYLDQRLHGIMDSGNRPHGTDSGDALLAEAVSPGRCDGSTSNDMAAQNKLGEYELRVAQLTSECASKDWTIKQLQRTVDELTKDGSSKQITQQHSTHKWSRQVKGEDDDKGTPSSSTTDTASHDRGCCDPDTHIDHLSLGHFSLPSQAHAHTQQEEGAISALNQDLAAKTERVKTLEEQINKLTHRFSVCRVGSMSLNDLFVFLEDLTEEQTRLQGVQTAVFQCIEQLRESMKRQMDAEQSAAHRSQAPSTSSSPSAISPSPRGRADAP